MSQSSSVTRTGSKTADITGNPTMRGVTKPVMLQAALPRIGKRPLAQHFLVKKSGAACLGAGHLPDEFQLSRLRRAGDPIAAAAGSFSSAGGPCVLQFDNFQQLGRIAAPVNHARTGEIAAVHGDQRVADQPAVLKPCGSLHCF